MQLMSQNGGNILEMTLGHFWDILGIFWDIFEISLVYLWDIFRISLSERTSGVPPVIFELVGKLQGVQFVMENWVAQYRCGFIQLEFSLVKLLRVHG